MDIIDIGHPTFGDIECTSVPFTDIDTWRQKFGLLTCHGLYAPGGAYFLGNTREKVVCYFPVGSDGEEALFALAHDEFGGGNH
jgi:hypothetical protein